MNSFLTIAFGLIFTLSSYGQDKNISRAISINDSILLRNFWIDFKNAITNKDKDQLATLFEFPFYCRPCIDNTILKTKEQVTIKVTRQLFYVSQYIVFFEKHISNEVEKHKEFETSIFFPAFDDINRCNGFMFTYTIIAPSKTWEGLQGFIYLNKRNGKYKITGIDSVP